MIHHRPFVTPLIIDDPDLCLHDEVEKGSHVNYPVNTQLDYASPHADTHPPEYEMLRGILGYLWLIVITWISLMAWTGGIFDHRTAGLCLVLAISLPLLLLLPLALLRRRRVLALTVLITFGASSVLAMAGYGLALIG